MTDLNKKDDQNRTDPLCEICNILKSHASIFRQPQFEGKKPFEPIHVDLIHEELGFSNKRYIFHICC